jgi:hypothetical protein
MRWTVAGLALASLIAGGSSLALVPADAKFPGPGQVGTFLVPPNDGYGIADCLTGARECGRVVAESYCQAKGFQSVVAYGPVAKEDITGTTGAQIGGDGGATVLTITCQN